MTWGDAFGLIGHMLNEIWSTLNFEVMGLHFNLIILGLLFTGMFIAFIKKIFSLNQGGGSGD